jgi:hypothetical protein
VISYLVTRESSRITRLARPARYGISSNPSFRFHHDDRRVEDRASLIVHVSRAFSLSFAAASHGRCCRRNSAAGLMTCWRRLRDWREIGTWDLMHFALLDWLARNEQIDWSRAVVDSCSRARCVWRFENRSESNGPSQTREQTSRDLRRTGPAHGRPSDWCQST